VDSHESEGGETKTVYKEAGILTIGDTPWTWEEHPAAKGQYLIGIIAEDMDGNITPNTCRNGGVNSLRHQKAGRFSGRLLFIPLLQDCLD
jgi:hypothetical protein